MAGSHQVKRFNGLIPLSLPKRHVKAGLVRLSVWHGNGICQASRSLSLVLTVFDKEKPVLKDELKQWANMGNPFFSYYLRRKSSSASHSVLQAEARLCSTHVNSSKPVAPTATIAEELLLLIKSKYPPTD